MLKLFQQAKQLVGTQPSRFLLIVWLAWLPAVLLVALAGFEGEKAWEQAIALGGLLAPLST